MKSKLKRLYWLLAEQFGIDLRRLFRSLRGMPRYLRHLAHFRRRYAGVLELQPCLYDWFEEGGATKSEYFLQDLHVAQQIYRHGPERHVDIGSRVDGFIAHVASFRSVEVFDIRAVTAQFPGIRFRQADLMNPAPELANYCDSLSCLHALEHFGLGRYGDPLDPSGSARGLRNMARIVRPGGRLYLSVPIGAERVVFNAHRVFSPHSIVRMAQAEGMTLRNFAAVDTERRVVEYPDWEGCFDRLAQQRYALGIFTFERTSASDKQPA
jgi:SAM-dependent methyltransferase